MASTDACFAAHCWLLDVTDPVSASRVGHWRAPPSQPANMMTRSFRSHLFLSLSVLLVLTLASSVLESPSGGPGLLRVEAIGKKLSEKQLGDIEDQWMDDEVEEDDDTPFKYGRNADGIRTPPPPPTGAKTEMGFATLKENNKKRTDETAGRWTDQMAAAGIITRGYPVEDNRILFVCDEHGFKHMTRLRSFVLRQPEITEFEWNNKVSRPGDVSSDDDAPADDPMSKFQAMQEEAAQRERRAERAKKKASKAKAKKAESEKRRKERENKKKAAEKKKKKAQQKKEKEEL